MILRCPTPLPLRVRIPVPRVGVVPVSVSVPAVLLLLRRRRVGVAIPVCSIRLRLLLLLLCGRSRIVLRLTLRWLWLCALARCVGLGRMLCVAMGLLLVGIVVSRRSASRVRWMVGLLRLSLGVILLPGLLRLLLVAIPLRIRRVPLVCKEGVDVCARRWRGGALRRRLLLLWWLLLRLRLRLRRGRRLGHGR